MRNTIDQIMTCVTDSAYQVNRALPAEHVAPEWREPGVAWFEAYQETLREQLEANDEEAP